MKVTAETITDEQVRQLWGEVLDRGDRDMVRIAQIALGEWRPAVINCDHELIVLGARARCATAWNARHGGDK